MKNEMALLLVVGLVACGGSSSPPEGTASSEGDGGSNPCSCEVTQNAERASLACGTTRCVGGTSITCGDSANVVRGASCVSSASSDGGSPGKGELLCSWGARGADSLKTTYSCPNEAAFASCRSGNSTSCEPKDRKPGTVELGGACIVAFTEDDPAATFELANDCAPNSAYAREGAVKGTFCVFGICTHPCGANSECQDVAPTATCDRDGFCVE